MSPGKAVLAFALGLAASVSVQAQGHGPHPRVQAAPQLSGLGTDHLVVTTTIPQAQAFFDQGLRLLYAFNHQESRRAFREAARLDPTLALAHWGEALTLAPNLNAPMSAENARLARAAILEAQRLRTHAGAMERLLIDALAKRFAGNPAAPRKPLDMAYADAMALAAAQYPDEPNVQTLYADAVMNTMPWNYWQKDGTAKPATAALLTALERTVAEHPNHAGAHHYLIHLLEASPTPERAEPSADRLGALMPSAGHMVHMPAHIYLRVGRYADAAEANVRAIAADEDYLAQCQAQGLYPVSYYPHNLHFLWAAATLEGRSTVAIDAARQVAAKVPHHHAGAVAWTADFPVTPWLAYVRFGHWQQMLTEPRPPVTQPYAMGIWHYGRGLGFLARGQAQRAEAELAALTAVMTHRAFSTTLKDLPLLTNLQMASRIVKGELASQAGRHDDAVAALREAVAIEDAIPYNEPPVWHQPTRQVLGALLLQAGRPGEAEAVYREDLAHFRENGWSLFGLGQALEAQGKAADAAAVRARFERAWARADVTLTSSRVLSEPAPNHATSTHPSHSKGTDTMVHSVALSNGVTLQYAERGSVTGVPVVFLHGVTDSWRSFEPLLPHLPPSIRALAVSVRGHGESTRPASGYTYSDMAEDVRLFMDALNLPSAIVVGHSMGSLVAQRLAADHPARVAGLVLMGAFASMTDKADIKTFYESEISALSDPIAPAFARAFQVSTLAHPIAPAQLDLFVQESLKVPARVWQAAFKGFTETPCPCADLGGLTVPTLLLWGDRDAYTFRRDQETLLAAVAGARLVAYADTGHALHWEQPQRVAADIVSFVYDKR